MSDFKKFSFRCKVNYAKVHAPDQKYDKYSVVMVVDEKGKKDLEKLLAEHSTPLRVFNPQTNEMQDRIKDLGDGTYGMNLGRKGKKKDGSPNFINVVAADGKTPISADTLIGNGSEVIVHGVSRLMENGQGAISLTGLQVIDLKAYAGEEYEAVDGYMPDTSDSDKSASATSTDAF